MKSVEKYRLYDLITLAVIGFVLEILSIKFTSGFASVGLAITIIAIIRWGKPGVLVGLAAGIGTVIGIQLRNPLVGNIPYEILLYGFGNLGAVLSVLVFKNFNKKNQKKTFEILLLYAIISYIGQSFCRGFIVTLYVNDFTKFFDEIYGVLDIYQVIFVGSAKQFFEIFSYSFINGVVGNLLMPVFVATVVLTICSKIDGILVDPIDYLIKQREEAKRSYEVFEGFNIPEEEPTETIENKQDKEVDEDESVSN